jgi:hypothetical protein
MRPICFAVFKLLDIRLAEFSRLLCLGYHPTASSITAHRIDGTTAFFTVWTSARFGPYLSRRTEGIVK